MKPILVLLLLLTPILTYYPCNRCVLKGDPCIYDTCTLPNFKCVSLGGTPICVEQIGPEQPCNATWWYDPCPSGFACDRTTTGNCELQGNKNFGLKNDGCLNSDYCSTGLTCQNNLCTSSQSNGNCQTQADCGWNQYCMNTGTSGQCKQYPTSGQSCTGQCAFMMDCENGVCVNYFSIAQGGACTDTVVCNPGLICMNGQCSSPVYDILLGPGAAWGGDCQPGEPGCTCNNGLANFQFLKEYSQTYYPDCPSRMTAFQNCMTQAGCAQISTNVQSCMRNKCWAQYVSFSDYCSTPPSLVASRCGGAAGLVVFVGMLFVVLLSF